MKTEDMNLNTIFTEVLNSIPQKIYHSMSSIWGSIGTAAIYCITFLGDRFPLLVYIAIAVIIDGLWGISTARKAKKFVLSVLITKSAIKIGAYTSLYGLVALIEKGFSDGFMFASSVMAAILIFSELWSTAGHIAIARPDLVATRIVKKYLAGEMAKKLDINEKDLDKILNKKDGIKAKKNLEKKVHNR